MILLRAVGSGFGVWMQYHLRNCGTQLAIVGATVVLSQFELLQPDSCFTWTLRKTICAPLAMAIRIAGALVRPYVCWQGHRWPMQQQDTATICQAAIWSLYPCATIGCLMGLQGPSAIPMWIPGTY